MFSTKHESSSSFSFVSPRKKRNKQTENIFSLEKGAENCFQSPYFIKRNIKVSHDKSCYPLQLSDKQILFSTFSAAFSCEKLHDSVSIITRLSSLAFKFFDLPTTSISPETIMVWKEGKSAETSHENLPDVAGETLERTNWLSFDDDCCKKIRFCISLFWKQFNTFKKTKIILKHSLILN